MKTMLRLGRFGVIAALCLLAASAHATGPTISVGGLKLYSNSICPIKAGDTGFWATGNVVFFRKADGTDITLGAGGGGSSTLAAAYTTGASQTDSTLLLDSTRLGLRIRDNATPIAGSLLSIQSSGGSAYWDFTPAALTSAYARGIGTAQTLGLTLSNTSNAALAAQQNSPMLSIAGQGWGTTGGATQAVSAGWQVTPVQGTTASADLSLFQTNGGGAATQSLQVAYGVTNSTASSMTVIGQANASTGAISFDTGNSGEVYFWSGVAGARADQYPLMRINGSGLYPFPDLTRQGGDTTHRWLEWWSRRYAGVEQTVAAAATITLDPAAGETMRITLSATAINAAGIAAGTGYPGEVIRTELIQDATGSRTLTQANFSSSWVFAGGAYTVTATANKRDVITWMWDAVASKFYEVSRATNL